MKRILLVILIITLSLSCLLIAVELNTFNISHYADTFVDGNIEESTGKDYFEFKKIVKDLFIYLKGKAGDEILEPNFNQREILHMQDVQVLFKYGFIIKYMALFLSIIIIAYFTIKDEIIILGKYMAWGLLVNWAILGILFLMVNYNFNKYFTYFHEIFFTNDLWLLDPNTDLLIQILPEEFFIKIATSIMLSFITFVATIQGIGFAIYKKGRNKNEENVRLFKR